MNSLLKKIFATVFIFFFFFSVFKPKLAIADSFTEARLSNEQNLESFIAGKLTPGGPSGLMPIVAQSLTSMAIGTYDEDGSLISRGGTGLTSFFIASLYSNRPISSKEYLAYSLNKINIATPTFAISATQGSDLFTPLIGLWVASRNVAYLFFIIIFVVTGFMIMFRSKLNPQTVINIQLALPKIIMSLILVTFSYAISGLIVDIAFIANSLIGQFLSGPLSSGPLIPANQHDLLGFLGSGGWGGISVGSQLGEVLKGMITFFISVFDDSGGGVDLSVLFQLIVAITIFGTTLKIFFTLFTKYVTILLQGIFSPFIFLFSALPSGGQVVGGYFKSMISAALAFPATYLFLEISAFILNEAGRINLRDFPPLNTTSLGNPTIIGTALGGAGVNGLAMFTSLGILMIIPSIPQAIDKALGAGGGIGAGAADFGGALKKIPIIGSLIG